MDKITIETTDVPGRYRVTSSNGVTVDLHARRVQERVEVFTRYRRGPVAALRRHAAQVRLALR